MGTKKLLNNTQKTMGTKTVKIKFTILLIGIAFTYLACISKKDLLPINNKNKVDYLEQGFKSPPDSIKPWVYWYWISGNVSKEGITKDLEAMSKVGIGEAFIGNIGMGEPYGDVKVLSEDWWKLTEHAIREGKRLGVDIGIFNSPGWSQSGGPWVKSTQAMRYFVNSEVTVQGGQSIVRKLAAVDSLQDVAVIAFKKPLDDDSQLADFKPQIVTVPFVDNASSLADNDFEQPVIFNAKSITIDLTVNQGFKARSLILHPAKIPFKAHVVFQAWKNNAYQTVKEFDYDRSHSAVTVGPIVYGPVSISIGEVLSTKFRLIINNIKNRAGNDTNSGFTEIVLSESPRLAQYIEKQLGKMFQRPMPLWDEYQWPDQTSAGTSAMLINEQSVIDVTKNMQPDGVLKWDAPVGNWVIMRFGVLPTGTKNGPASPEATGFEVDKMSKTHLASHFDSYIGKLLKRMPAADRTAFKHVVADSYEMGSQNYTEGFAVDFNKRYGYNPLLWLPVLSGRIIGSAEQSNRFLWDLRRFVADKVAYDYVGGLRDLSQKNGLRIWLENYGHWGFPSEFLMYGGQSNDIAGEFWTEGSLGSIECRAASSAAHIYGVNRVYAESFTSNAKAYSLYPALLKKRGDWSFTEGINHVLLHVYIHQPYEDRNPGMNAWYGTEFNRKNTWFEKSKIWIDYLRRNMFLLQQGKPINDVAYFIGEDAPKMTGVRDPELPKGYSYDYINAEVILKRLSVRDGKLVLPDGTSYRLLVLPALKTMRPLVLKKIRELVNAGATVLGPKPSRSPSMENYPAADKEVQNIANELWKGVDGTRQKSAAYGKGWVISGLDIQSTMNKIGVHPDVEFPKNKPILWTHRKTADADIYFITNQSDSLLSISPIFRVDNKQPELWDATTGSHRDLPQYTITANRTTVPLQLAPAQSYFVVFRRKATAIKGLNFPKPVLMQTINTPYQVKFNANNRGPANAVTFNQLNDWAQSKDESIRYYSGTAIYTNSFNMPTIPKQQRVFITIDQVKDIASIKLNGKDVGGLWTAPLELDITDALVKGNNQIEIEVTNLWVNRLIGDSKVPVKERKTWTVTDTYKPGDKLQPSGLIGEMKLVTKNYH
jgi:hypothetical protein